MPSSTRTSDPRYADEPPWPDGANMRKLYNLCNITGSALVVVTFAIAVGISARIGFDSDEKLIHSYNVLMGYFGAITVVCTVPFFIVQKHRPGQQLPEGTNWWTVGFKYYIHPDCFRVQILTTVQTNLQRCQVCQGPSPVYALPSRILYASGEYVYLPFHCPIVLWLIQC